MKRNIFAAIILFWGFSAIAQNNTFYFNSRIYQSIELNPARQHRCRISLGMPVLSSTYFILKNQGLSYGDLFYKMPNNPSQYYFNLDSIYNKMPEVSYFPVNTKLSLGHLAFTIKGFYISFSSNLNFNFNIAYPRSLLTIKDGLYFTDNRYFSLSDLSVMSYAYTDFGINVSKQIIPNLTVGVRLKRYTGIYYFNTRMNFDLKVSTADTSIYDWNFQNVNYDVRYSGPVGIKIIYDDQKLPKDVEFSTIDDLQNLIDKYGQSGTDYFQNTMDLISLMNKKYISSGWGVDFGVIYKLFDKIELSASVLDLGYINWKVNPTRLYNNAFNFTFTGADPGKYIGDSSIIKLFMSGNFSIKDSIIGSFIDTLIPLITPKHDSTKFRQPTNTTIIGAIGLKPVNAFTLGFMYRGIFINQKLVSQYCISGTLEFLKGWSLMMSYTFFNKSYNNIGAGLSVKLLPVQFYIVMDNVSIPALAMRFATVPEKSPDLGISTKWVKNTNMINLQFGLNFYLGCRSKKKFDYGLLD